MLIVPPITTHLPNRDTEFVGFILSCVSQGVRNRTVLILDADVEWKGVVNIPGKPNAGNVTDTFHNHVHLSHLMPQNGNLNNAV